MNKSEENLPARPDLGQIPLDLSVESTAPFKVLEFSAQNLHESLSNPRCSSKEIGKKKRVDYLHGYLVDLSAQTIVVERSYTDRDYLDDFASYYVRCFQDYDRRCSRLHFFSIRLDHAEFLRIVSGEASSDELLRSYLGFVVARPLPDAIIGRTVLKTYGADANRRNYTCVLNYDANLFGIKLSLKSLAFQEQDTVLAACATASLWSCFNKTKDLFGSQSPTPAEITRAATQVVHHARPIPSHGLIAQQICNAIRQVGLEPEILSINPKVPLPSLMYSHLRMGIPVLLGVEVEGKGLHAIAVGGYSLLETRHLSQEVGASEKCIPMTGLRINEFYAHDDQIGPFSRLVVKPQSGRADCPVIFEGSWLERGQPLPLYPKLVIVPVYNKIRVTFNDIRKWLTRLTSFLDLVLHSPAPDGLLEWDLFLTTTNEFKKSLIDSRKLDGENLASLLVRQHPRFIWRAICRWNGTAILELLFDATDMARSLPVYCVTWYDQAVRDAARKQLERPQLRSLLVRYLTDQFLEFMLKTTHMTVCVK